MGAAWTLMGAACTLMGGGGGGGGAGGHQKQMIQMGLTTASLSLGFLVVCTVIIAFSSGGPDCTFKAKETPILMALFVGALAGGTWKLRGHLMQGYTLLDSLPPFFTGNGPSGGKPQKPPQVAQWENWTFSWLLCFVLIVWGGIIMLEFYSVAPLEKVCQTDEDSSGGVLKALLQMRRLVYALVVFVTFVPLFMAWGQQRRWGQQYKEALNRYNQQMYGQSPAGAAAQAAATATPAYDPKSPENLTPQEGGYSPKTGSSRLFDATYAMAELVGFASPNAYAAAPQAAPNYAPPPPAGPAPDDFDMEAFV